MIVELVSLLSNQMHERNLSQATAPENLDFTLQLLSSTKTFLASYYQSLKPGFQKIRTLYLCSTFPNHLRFPFLEHSATNLAFTSFQHQLNLFNARQLFGLP